MKFKFHWGWAIAVFYTSFVIAMIYLVIYSQGVDHSLVRDNYYDYDVGYEKLIGEKKRNSHSLKNPVAINYDSVNKRIEIKFPEELRNLTGEIWFYRVNNEKLDFRLKVKTGNNNMQYVDVSNLAKGKWQINIDWTDGNKKYLDEKVVYLND